MLIAFISKFAREIKISLNYINKIKVMKKSFLILLLQLSVVGMFAQSWRGSEPADGSYNHETVLYATLQAENTSSSFVIGAFIDNVCRASASPEMSPVGESSIYTLRIMGDRTDDQGKTITFKAYDEMTGLEYTLSKTITFDGEQHGYPSNPEVFTLSIPVGFMLDIPNQELDVNKTYTLTDFLTTEPENADLPTNLMWSVMTSSYEDASEYATIDGNTMKTLKVSDELLVLNLATDATGAGYQAFFNIVMHATSITLNTTSITVNKDDNATLTTMLNSAYTLNPAGANDYVQWEIEDESIITFSGIDFMTLNGGTTRVRPYITKVDGTNLYPASNAWITVTVYVPVERIMFDTSKFGPTIPFNVGDRNVYSRLTSAISVYPDDATDKSYTIEWPTDYFTVQGLTSVTAKQAGMGTIAVKVTANNPTAASGEITEYVNFEIQEPGTQATFGTNPMYVVLPDGAMTDISSRVRENVTINGNSMYWNGSVTIEGTAVRAADASVNSAGVDGQFYAVAEGTATVKVTLTWNDYDSWDGTTAEAPTKSATFSLTVNVTTETSLAGFQVAYTEAVAGVSTGTITLTPQPEGATFTPADINVTFSSTLPATWTGAVTTTLKSATTEKIVYEYSSEVPTFLTLTATDGNNELSLSASDATAGFTGIEIGYSLNLTSGWQWRSNPVGNVGTSELNSIYSTNVDEIRTQTDLLCNDPSWGLFGSLLETEGISQYQCYKVNMKASNTAVLHAAADPTGAPASFGNQYSVTLRASGWTWVGNPYFYKRLLTNAISTATLSEGIVIIGKTASSEYSGGTWNGLLTVLEPGQGYIVYNPTRSEVNLTFLPESRMDMGDEVSAGVKSLGRTHANIWQYDDSRFANNMTMVSELAGIDDPETYSIGAFVADECRGEGVVIDGKAYITVHCNDGELVSFKLYNTLTGEIIDVNETLRAQARVGSIKSPYTMHAHVATGILNTVDADHQASEIFDLAGRRAQTMSKGVYIVNGKKVVVK